MATIDIILGVFMLVFMFMGFKSGFVKKIISIACLALGLVIATKFSADISELVFEPMDLSTRMGFIFAFLTIIITISLTQSLLYKWLIKDLVEGIWNRIAGIFIGIIEGGLVLSVALILLSIYLKLPQEETKANSQLYKPIKNFAPLVFDQVNTFLPESEDFYQQIFEAAQKQMKPEEKK